MKSIIKSQYRAALAMLREAIEKYGDPLWLDTHYPNPFWRIAFHTLFFTNLYSSPSVEAFRPWDKHVDELECLGPMMHQDGRLPKEGPPYAKADLLEYLTRCEEKIDGAVDTLDLDGPSGFPWLPFNKTELQFYNIRHIQHHAGQLIDRVRTVQNEGVRWVGMR